MNTILEKLKSVYELCKKYLRETEELLARGDGVQASEKLYKIVEECIKVLAELHQLEEYKESTRIGRWSVKRLDSAARKLADIYGDEVYLAWTIAFEKLHVRGFHEKELTPEEVKQELPNVEVLLTILEEALRRR